MLFCGWTGAAYARTERVQLDALHDLGNTNNWSWSWPWTWEGMLPYYKKRETVCAPNVSQVAAGASIVPEFQFQKAHPAMEVLIAAMAIATA